METGYCQGEFPKAVEMVKKFYPTIPSVNIPGQCIQRKILNYILLRIQIKQVNPFLICVKRRSYIIRSKLELLYLVNIETISALYVYNYTCN